MGSLIRYHVSYYIKSSKFVMPLLTFFLYLAVSYSSGPKTVTTSGFFSAAILYLLMVWAGFVYSDCENSISEQLLLLKCNNMNVYYISKMIFLMIFGAFMSVMAVIVPAIWSLVFKIGGGSLFSDGGFCFLNVIQLFLAHAACAFLGAMVGYFFQPRVFKNRILTVIVAFLFALMGFIKGPLTQDIPILKVVTWVFPPVFSMFNLDTVKDSPNVVVAGPFILTIIIMLVYAVVLGVGNVYLTRKKGF